MTALHSLYNCFLKITDRAGPLALLAARLWIAKTFFTSGLTKIKDFDSTIQLFEYEYMVPVISPEIAAYCSTFFELACPIALVLGLATRLATLPLLAMTAVIQLTYLQHTDHIHWALLLCVLLTHGAGKLSVDAWLKRKFASNLA